MQALIEAAGQNEAAGIERLGQKGTGLLPAAFTASLAPVGRDVRAAWSGKDTAARAK